MLKTNLISLFLFAVFLSGCSLVKSPDVSKNIEPTTTSDFITSPSPSLTSTTTPILKPKPKFSVSLLATPDVRRIWTDPVYVDVVVKNISLEPFITSLQINSCTFTDETEAIRQSSISFAGGSNFEKAILPSEERTLSHQSFNLDAGGVSGLNAKGQLCSYDLAGNYGCKQIKELRALSCEFRATNQTGSSQLTVVFP